MRRQISRQIIRYSRRLLRSKRIRKLRAVRRIHEWVYGFGCSRKGSDVQSAYRGLCLSGPARDFSIVHQLFGGYYEEVEVALFERLAARSRLIIDIGANIGLYACLGARRLTAGGHLVAFEPIPENVDYLRGNLAKNNLSERVSIEAAAVGETNGSVTMYLAKGIGHHSVAAENATGWSHSVSVPMVSLDSYLKERPVGEPDLIKIDAEGYDGFVLRGARNTLERTQPTLLIEYSFNGLENCGFSADEFLDFVFTCYRHVFIVHDLRVFSCTREEIVRLGQRGKQGINLLAINRSGHLAIIEEWCSAKNAFRDPAVQVI